MTSCADLEWFFDGEMPDDTAEEFRRHIAGCVRCQNMLASLMQEAMVTTNKKRTERT